MIRQVVAQFIVCAAMYIAEFSLPTMFVFSVLQFTLKEFGLPKQQIDLFSWAAPLIMLSIMSDKPVRSICIAIAGTVANNKANILGHGVESKLNHLYRLFSNRNNVQKEK